jgi:uncharacterized repeat protein (TIGR03803 family)
VDLKGTVYGTTCCGDKLVSGGYEYVPGIVFRVIPPGASGGAWKEEILYEFTEGFTVAYGYLPNTVTLGKGSLFGTTQKGGAWDQGVVFELTPSSSSQRWTESVLYGFTGGLDGGTPKAGVILDSAGNLYGTTAFGGSSPCVGKPYGCGAVFKLSPNGDSSWTETTLYDFAGVEDGGLPNGNLLMKGGFLLGTTSLGGSSSGQGLGTVFEVVP